MPEWGHNDPWGSAKQLHRSFRWTLPDFTYAYDASFVNYFGPEGMVAVHDAIHVINDFFENGDYSGMSQLDLHKHGFVRNYNSSWINTTAQNGQILDIKSMVLGTMVNFLGLGNPHKHMYTISSLTNSGL